MDSSRDSEFDARLKRIEAVLTDLQRSMDALARERRPAPAHERATEPSASSRASPSPAPPVAPPRQRQATPLPIDRGVASLFASHDAEWWLSRVGIGFLVLGVLLLYGYAVDHDWIRPPVRVLAGTVVGGLLFWFAGRVRSEAKAPGTDLGFRELLLGGALAIWYVTAYAAGVWYQLLPMPAVRLILFLLAILSTWIALQENREIFALAAVATGFATPFILPAPVHSLTELSLYLGAVTAIGLIIYLLRGWQSILWITFAAFWVIAAQTANAQATAPQPIAPSRLLDSFDSVTEWSAFPAAGVDLAIHPDSGGAHGRAMRLDFDFHGRGGYAVAHRLLYLPLPPNYQFSFAIRGDAPSNTLEFKLIDSTGANVWRSNNVGFVFPRAWTTISIDKRQIPFAWGRPLDLDLKRVAALELAITAGAGGKGSVWLDDLTITPLSEPIVTSIAALPTRRPQPVMRVRSAAVGSVALTILLLVAAVVFTRTPVLRRQLLKTGTSRYTSPPVTEASKGFVDAMDSLSAALGGGKTAPDSVLVWALMLMSAFAAISLLDPIWPSVPDEIWGASFLVLGLGALLYSQRGPQPDAEISHVALTAGVFWTLIGIARLASTPESIPACALVTALIINVPLGKFSGPRTLIKLVIALVLWLIAVHELSLVDTGFDHFRWILSDIVTLGAAAFIAWRLIADGTEVQGKVLGTATYLTALIVLWSALNPLWAPLVTASYAGLGATLLILSQRGKARPVLKYLGGVTMVIVVARLLFIDLASVETIWRILLFLVCGAVFLYTAYQMQPARRTSRSG